MVNNPCQKLKNSVYLNMTKILSFSIVSLLFAGCASGKKEKITPTTLQTSYDFARPSDIGKPQPVWVLPTFQQGWMPAKVDPKTGEWNSGHYKATMVEQGHWATLEEAELSGRKYMLPSTGQQFGGSDVIRKSGSEEINATIIEQRLSRLERNRSTPTDNSLNNQKIDKSDKPKGLELPNIPIIKRDPIKVEPKIEPRIVPPPIKLPGLDEKPEVKDVKVEMPKIDKVEKPKSDEIDIMPKDVKKPIVAPILPIMPILPKAETKDEFKDGSLYVMPQKSGEKTVNTPKGDVKIDFNDKSAKVTFNGKTIDVPITNQAKRIQIKLP